MPIVLRILEGHGWKLQISDSKELGGACFEISSEIEAGSSLVDATIDQGAIENEGCRL